MELEKWNKHIQKIKLDLCLISLQNKYKVIKV